jgi:hypothetical protein
MCTLLNRVKNVPKEKGFAKKIITAKSAAARTVEFVEIFNVPLSQSLSLERIFPALVLVFPFQARCPRTGWVKNKRNLDDKKYSQSHTHTHIHTQKTPHLRRKSSLSKNQFSAS